MKSVLLRTTSRKSIMLIRIMVGAIYFSEGIQKLLLPQLMGIGRFQEKGVPLPEYTGSFAGFAEITCGLLILVGFLTRLATIPLLLITLSAFGAINAEIYIQEGLWSFLHHIRIDWALTFANLFLLIEGGGKWSVDYKLAYG